MSKSTSDLCLIMRAGGIKIDAKFSTSDLCLIARAGGETGAMLFVTNAVGKSTPDLCLIGGKISGRAVF